LNFLELRAVQEKQKTLLNYWIKQYTILRTRDILRIACLAPVVMGVNFIRQNTVHEE